MLVLFCCLGWNAGFVLVMVDCGGFLFAVCLVCFV